MQYPSQPVRRYFGLTLIQLVILACMGLFSIGLVVGMGWFVLGDSVQPGVELPTLAQLPTSMPPAAPEAPTATLEETEPPVPTITPTATETPIPYRSLIPAGWNQFLGGAVEIWLPPSFVGGDMTVHRTQTLAALDDLDPFFSAAVDFGRNLPPECVLFAVDSQRSPLLVITDMRLCFDPEPVSDLADYVYAIFGDLPAGTTNPPLITESTALTPLWGEAAHRVLFEIESDGLQLKKAMYFVLDGDTVWVIMFTTHINEFYDRRPAFEQVFQTFRIAP
ncbi:MAG: hypothetical protein JXB85_12915 [Anaerolineales bacterium]|nr:hypothetical protein [Anaerolineales bacterium]